MLCMVLAAVIGLESAISNGVSFLISKQAADGYWSDRQMPALTALAEYCSFLPHITVQNDMREEKICLKKTRGRILSAGLS